MIALAVTWMAKPGQEDNVTALFRRLTEESRTEPGCLQYQVHRHVADRRRFFIYEQYVNQAGLDAHRAAPHFARYAKAELPVIAERVEGSSTNPSKRMQARGDGIEGA